MSRGLALVALCATATAAADPPPLAGVSYVEAGAKAGPLVVALHHQGGSPEDAAQLVASRLPHAHIVAPAAEPQHGRHSWYTGSSAAAKNASVRAATRRLERFIAALPGDGPVIVTGYSQGAIMALALAIESPARIRAVIAISGRVPTSMLAVVPDHPNRPSVMLLHGRGDRTISFASGERSRDVLAALGYPVTFTGYADDGHGLSRKRLTEWLDALVRLLE